MSSPFYGQWKRRSCLPTSPGQMNARAIIPIKVLWFQYLHSPGQSKSSTDEVSCLWICHYPLWALPWVLGKNILEGLCRGQENTVTLLFRSHEASNNHTKFCMLRGWERGSRRVCSMPAPHEDECPAERWPTAAFSGTSVLACFSHARSIAYYHSKALKMTFFFFGVIWYLNESQFPHFINPLKKQ